MSGGQHRRAMVSARVDRTAARSWFGCRCWVSPPARHERQLLLTTVEAAFATASGIGVGDQVTLDGRPYDVVGVAVTAAMAPYPEVTCVASPGCVSGAAPEELCIYR